MPYVYSQYEKKESSRLLALFTLFTKAEDEVEFGCVLTNTLAFLPSNGQSRTENALSKHNVSISYPQSSLGIDETLAGPAPETSNFTNSVYGTLRNPN
jgi:hypothetical protein